MLSRSTKNSIFVLFLILALVFLAGCGKKEEVQVSSKPEKTIVVEQPHEDIENVKIEPEQEKEILESLTPPTYENLELPEDLSEEKPRLAIVIDDLGEGRGSTEELFKLSNYSLTVAVMPGGKYATEEAQMAKEKGFSVIVHQPMEALGTTSGLGDGAIFADMSDEEILDILDKNFEKVPNAVGMNNHMGSMITSDKRLMQIVLEYLNSKDLFFFDSITTNKSVVTEVADSLGMKTLINVKFLDNENTEEYVLNALLDAVEIAKQRGYAAVIGHSKTATVKVLTQMLPELEKMGIELVSLEDLMNDATLDTKLQFVPVQRDTSPATAD